MVISAGHKTYVTMSTNTGKRLKFLCLSWFWTHWPSSRGTSSTFWACLPTQGFECLQYLAESVHFRSKEIWGSSKVCRQCTYSGFIGLVWNFSCIAEVLRQRLLLQFSEKYQTNLMIFLLLISVVLKRINSILIPKHSLLFDFPDNAWIGQN